MTMWLTMVRLCGLVLAVMASSVCASLNNGITATMWPQTDVFVFLGKSFEINCSISAQPLLGTDNDGTHTMEQPSNITDPDTFLSVYNISIKKGGAVLPENSFTFNYYEDLLTLQLIKNNATVEDRGYYSCNYNNDFKGLKMVNVGDPPGQPSVYCISYNFVNMTCYVTLSNHTGDIPFRWHMEYKKASDGQWIIIPNTSCTERECRFTSRTDPRTSLTFQRLSDYYIRVIVENRLANVSSDVVRFAPWDIVKPDPVQTLNSTLINASSARIVWSYPELLDPGNRNTVLEYDILVTTEKGWDVRQLGFEHVVGVMAESLVLDDLVCDTRYQVAVRSKPVTAQGAIYWSDWSNTTFSTPSTRPEQSTQLSDGSFYVLDGGVNGKVGLVLYWKNPAERYRCGAIESYVLQWTHISSTVEPMTAKTSESATMRYVGLQDTGRTAWTKRIRGYRLSEVLNTHLSDTGAYMLNMYTVNNVGESIVSSELVISGLNQANDAQVSWVSVVMSEGAALVSWAMDGRHCDRVTGMTYYWCIPDLDKSMNQSYINCKADFDWLQVDVDDACTVGNQWINSTRDMTSMRFAVSVNMSGISGGMVWEKFRFKTHDAAPAEPQYQVSPVAGDHRKLEVSLFYNNIYNLEEGGRPENLQVVYMAAKEAESCTHVMTNPGAVVKNVTVDFSRPGMTISGLTPATSYAVCARYYNTFGAGVFGKLVLVETSSEDSTLKWMGIGIAIFVLSVMLALMVYFCIRWRNQMLRKTQVCAPEIPELPEYQAKYTPNGSITKFDPTGMKNQKPSSHDSGKGSDSPGSSCGKYEEIDVDQEADVKENTPILARRKVSSTSCTSGLSGYVQVDKYDQTGSEGLLSLRDDEAGESNASFNPSHVGNNPPAITLDDVSINMNSQGDYDTEDEDVVALSTDIRNIHLNTIETKTQNGEGGVMYIIDSEKHGAGGMSPYCPESKILTTDRSTTDRSATDRSTTDRSKPVTLPKTQNGERDGMYVGDSDKQSAGGTRPYCPESKILTTDRSATDSPTTDRPTTVRSTTDRSTTDRSKTVTLPFIAEDPNECLDSSTGLHENGTTDDFDMFKDGYADKTTEMDNSTQYSQATVIEQSDGGSAGVTAIEGNTEILASESMVDLGLPKSTIDSEANIENPINLSVHAANSNDRVDNLDQGVANETDIFSDEFDDKMGSFGFDCYQNPDLISLGQGSILSFDNPDVISLGQGSIISFGTDAEDTRSMRSYTSADKESRSKHEADSEVLEICNGIKSEFEDMCETDLGSADIERTSSAAVDQVYRTNHEEDSEKDILRKGSDIQLHLDISKAEIEEFNQSHDKKMACNSDGEVNSYVKAGVTCTNSK